MAASWRVLSVQSTAPAIGTAKCSSYIAGTFGLRTATCTLAAWLATSDEKSYFGNMASCILFVWPKRYPNLIASIPHGHQEDQVTRGSLIAVQQLPSDLCPQAVICTTIL
jgi:hypothetical protein